MGKMRDFFTLKNAYERIERHKRRRTQLYHSYIKGKGKMSVGRYMEEIRRENAFITNEKKLILATEAKTTPFIKNICRKLYGGNEYED